AICLYQQSAQVAADRRNILLIALLSVPVQVRTVERLRVVSTPFRPAQSSEVMSRRGRAKLLRLEDVLLRCGVLAQALPGQTPLPEGGRRGCPAYSALCPAERSRVVGAFGEEPGCYQGDRRFVL